MVKRIDERHVRRYVNGVAGLVKFSMLALLLGFLPPSIQAQWRGGSIGGVVMLSSGERARGVTLSVSAGGVTYMARSRRSGAFLLADLPPGNYELTAEKSGLGTVIVSGVRVEPALRTIARVIMPESEDDIVTVTEESNLADAARVWSGLTVDRSGIVLLPPPFTLAGVVERGGLLRLLGAGSGDSLQFDGIRTAGDDLTFRTLFDFGAVEAIRLVGAERDVTSSSIGPAVDLTFRSTERSSGTLRFSLAPAAWADGEEETRTYVDGAALVGGELIDGRLWGITSYARRHRAETGSDLDGENAFARLELQATPRITFRGLGTRLDRSDVDADFVHLRGDVLAQLPGSAIAIAVAQSDDQRIGTDSTARAGATFWSSAALATEIRAGAELRDRDEGDLSSHAFWISDVARWSRLTVVAGLRYADSEAGDDGESTFLPRLQATFSSLSGLTLFRAGANRFREEERLTPSQVQELDELFVSVEHSILPEFTWEVALSNRQGDRRCDLCAERADVIELFATKRLSNSWMMQVHAEAIDSDAAHAMWPEWSYAVSGAVQLPMSTSVGVVASGAARLGEQESYHDIDARFSRSFDLDRISLGLSLDLLNLLGNASIADEEPSRAVRFEARVDF